MTDDIPPNLALLPAGLRDLLPPEAETEAASVEAIMDAFAAHGYQRVKPPLLEFEDGLLAGNGAAMTDQTFRLMDPDSHRMMGLRADMTPQVARIATTRLAHVPRPLRLSYAGQSLRVRSAGLAAERQVAQAGIELIGHDSPEADAEIVQVGAEALAALGLTRISFDLTLPPLVPTLLEEAGLPPPVRASLSRALDRKDAAAVADRGGKLAGTLAENAESGHGLNLSFFPLVDAAGLFLGASDRRLASAHWSRTDIPEILLLERDARQRGYHGFVRVETAPAGGEAIEVSVRRSGGAGSSPDADLITSEEAEGLPVRFEFESVEHPAEGPLSVAEDLPFNPFEVTLRIPASWAGDEYRKAVATLLERFLKRYRAYQAYGQHL